HRLVDPIIRLRAGILRLERGDLDFQLELRTGDELEELAGSMNQMARTLQTTYQALAEKLLELDEKAKQLSTTYEIAEAINRSLDFDGLFKDVIQALRKLVPADHVLLGLITAESDRIELAALWP